MSGTALTKVDFDKDETIHALSLMRKFDQMRNERRQCDLIIKVGNNELHVHRNVLMAGSEYFDAMFSHDMQESLSGIVEMKEMKFSILKKCIDYIYTGKVTIIESECDDILYVASMLQLGAVCDKVAPFLQNRMNVKSFFTIKKIAAKYDLENLNKVSNEFALENLGQLAKEKEFGELEMEYVKFLIEYRKKSQNEKDEKALEFILLWIKADFDNHHDKIGEMLDMVDFANLSSDIITTLLDEEPVCYESAEFMKKLYLMEKNKPKKIIAQALPSAEPNAIVVFDQSLMSLRAYHVKQKSWITHCRLLPSMVGGGTRYAAVAANHHLYVLMENQNFYSINLHEEKSHWVKLKDMFLDHSSYLRATVHGDNIYVAGNASMERYSMSSKRWTIMCHFGAPCNYRALVTRGGDILTIGGKSGGPSKGVSSFSVISGFQTWTAEVPMLYARQTCAATVYKGEIFVAGGDGDNCVLDSVEHFDPDEEVWTSLEPMVEPRDEFSLCVVDKCLYAVGGKSGSDQSIEMYDPLTRKWDIVQRMSNTVIESQASVAVYLPYQPAWLEKTMPLSPYV